MPKLHEYFCVMKMLLCVVVLSQKWVLKGTTQSSNVILDI